MLSFRVLDLEPDPVCRYDRLDVYNGHAAVDAQRIGRFCGTFRPGAILSTSNRLMLQMVADEGTGGRGFLVWYSGGLPHISGKGLVLTHGGSTPREDSGCRLPLTLCPFSS